jgi:hypothetical protein
MHLKRDKPCLQPDLRKGRPPLLLIHIVQDKTANRLMASKVDMPATEFELFAVTRPLQAGNPESTLG